MGTTSTGRRRTLASIHRVELLHLLMDGREHTLAELADATGLHENTTREHLQRLAGEGWVERTAEDRHVRGRPRTLYRWVRTPSAAARERARQAIEAAALERRLFPVRTVAHRQAAGATQDQLDVLTEHLDATGFDPDLDAPALQVHLRTCPFREMVDQHRDIVCSVHHKLIATALAQTDGPLTAGELRPFDTPDRCTLDLDRADVAAC